MKLKEGIVTGNIDGSDFAVATGKLSSKFNGIINNNPSAGFIFELLKNEQTFESVVDALEKKYDAPRDVLEADAKEFLAQLDKYGILEK